MGLCNSFYQHSSIARHTDLLKQVFALLNICTPRMSPASKSKTRILILLMLSAGSTFAQTANGSSPVVEIADEKDHKSLSENFSPLARQGFDQGPVHDELLLRRMLLLLQRNPAQEASDALNKALRPCSEASQEPFGMQNGQQDQMT